jgi:hypothetical protein
MPRAGDDAEGIGNESWIAGFESFGHAGCDGLGGVEVLGWVEGLGLQRVHGISFASHLATAMSLVCVDLSPPQRSTISRVRAARSRRDSLGREDAKFTDDLADRLHAAGVAEGEAA